eukprot:10087875-Karenia_brevis.AAC.1
MEKYRARSRSQSEGISERSVSEPREKPRRSVTLSRDLTSELDAVAEDEDRKGVTVEPSIVPHSPKELLDTFADPADDDDNTT